MQSRMPPRSQGRTPPLNEVPSAVYNLDEPLAPGVESKWWEVAELTKVDLSRNAIVFLPEGRVSWDSFCA